MAQPPCRPSQRTGAMMTGLAAIPVVVVTTMVWLGDVASSTDGRDAVAGGLGLLGGLVMGLLVHRMVVSVDVCARSIGCRLRLVALRLGRVPTTSTPRSRLRISVAVAAAAVFVPAEVGRRGPPARVV